MSLFWNSLRAISRSDCVPQTNLKSFQWSRISRVASYWNTFFFFFLLKLVGNTLGLCAWGSVVLPTACSCWVLEVVVVLVGVDKVLEAGAGSFHTSIQIFRTSGGDRPSCLMGIFANIPARELFLHRSCMRVHLVLFYFFLRTLHYWVRPIWNWRSYWGQALVRHRSAFCFRKTVSCQGWRRNLLVRKMRSHIGFKD